MPINSSVFLGIDSDYKSALNELKALLQIQQHSLETLDITIKLILERSEMDLSRAIELAIKFTGETSGTLYSKLDPNKIGEYARALDVGVNYGITIMTRYMGWTHEKAEEILKKLVYDYPSHGYVIDIDELQALGLPVDKIEDKEELFPHVMKLRDMLLENRETVIELIAKENGEDLNNKNNNKEERDLALQLS